MTLHISAFHIRLNFLRFQYPLFLSPLLPFLLILSILSFLPLIVSLPALIPQDGAEVTGEPCGKVFVGDRSGEQLRGRERTTCVEAEEAGGLSGPRGGAARATGGETIKRRRQRMSNKQLVCSLVMKDGKQ